MQYSILKPLFFPGLEIPFDGMLHPSPSQNTVISGGKHGSEVLLH